MEPQSQLLSKEVELTPLNKKTTEAIQQNQKPKSKMWIIHALITGVGIGVGNFLVARIAGQGIIALSYVGLIAAFLLGLYRIIEAIKFKINLGSFINYQKSNFFTPEKHFKSSNIVPLLGNGLTNTVNLMAMTFAYKYAAIAGINQGVLLTLNSLSGVYNIFIFYFFFKERIQLIQFIGMLFMLLCVCLIGISGQQSNNSEENQQKAYYAIISLLFGLISPLALSTKHIFIRNYKKVYNTFDMALDGLIIEYSIYILMAIYTFGATELKFNWDNLLIGTVASVFIITGKICIALAVSFGLAGPAASLANTQTIYATILTTTVANQQLTPLEISGLISGICGASIISLGDYIVSMFRSK